jgi:hypothetical protein
MATQIPIESIVVHSTGSIPNNAQGEPDDSFADFVGFKDALKHVEEHGLDVDPVDEPEEEDEEGDDPTEIDPPVDPDAFPEDDEDEPGEYDGQDQLPEHIQAKGPRKSGAKSRISQLTRDRHEAIARENAALARAQQLEAELAELRAGKQPPAEKPQTKQTKQAADGRPKASDFEFGEYDPEYQDAMVAWRVEAAMNKRAQDEADEQAAQEQEAAAEKIADQWAETVVRGQEEIDDFDETVLSGNDTWQLSRQVWELAVDSPVGHRVLHHLASNPDESRRIFKLSLPKQAAEFGRLEDRFSQPSSDQDQSEVRNKRGADLPRAPAPTSRTRGASGASKVSPATTDFAAFKAMHRAQQAAKR